MFLISNNSLGQAVSRGLVWYFCPPAWIMLMLFVLGNAANLPDEYLESSRGGCWSIFFNKFDHNKCMPPTWFPFPCWTGRKPTVDEIRKSRKIFILTVRMSNFEWAKRSNINTIFCEFSKKKMFSCLFVVFGTRRKMMIDFPKKRKILPNNGNTGRLYLEKKGGDYHFRVPIYSLDWTAFATLRHCLGFMGFMSFL